MRVFYHSLILYSPYPPAVPHKTGEVTLSSTLMRKKIIVAASVVVLAAIAGIAFLPRQQETTIRSLEVQPTTAKPLQSDAAYTPTNEITAPVETAVASSTPPQPQPPAVQPSVQKKTAQPAAPQPAARSIQNAAPNVKDEPMSITINGKSGCVAYMDEPVDLAVAWTAPVGAECRLDGYQPDASSAELTPFRPVSRTGGFTVSNVTSDNRDYAGVVIYGDGGLSFQFMFECSINGVTNGVGAMATVGRLCECAGGQMKPQC